MNVIICGAGEVGLHSAEVLAEAGHSITVIDASAKRLSALADVLDVHTLTGNATHAETLLQADSNKADLYIAATDRDETNLLSASLASGLGAGRTIARVQHSCYFERRGIDYDKHLGIDHLVCPDYITAVEIAQSLRNPGALAVESFARGRIEMQQLPVSDDAPVIGKPLAELKFPGPVRLASIERGDTAFIPDAESTIQRGDVVTLIGESTAFEEARKLIHTSANGRRRVVIMGGTPLAVWLCRQLHTRAFSVRLLEPDAKRAESLAEKLDWITVVHANPADTEPWEEQRIDNTDAFVAVTDDDEHNILTAARAKSMGTRLAVAVLQRPTYLHLLEHVGIDRAFSPRASAVTQILRLLDDAPLRRLASLAVGIAEVFEIHVPATAKNVIHMPLRSVKLPPRTIIAAIQRGDEVHVPGSEDWIAPNDTVVAIAPAQGVKKLRSLFSV